MAVTCNDSHVFNASHAFPRGEQAALEAQLSCPSVYTAGELGVGLALTLLGACVLALSMVVQRYALAHPLERIPYCGMRLRRSTVWASGLGLYCVANGLKVVALMYGPMTVLSSVFSTLLVFNLIIASRVLGEAVTPPKVAGALLILAGAGIATGATPQGVPKDYTPRDIRALLYAAPPYGWLSPLLFGACVLTSVVGIVLLERRFPLGAEGELEPELIGAIESRMSVGPGVGMHTRMRVHAHD